MLCRVFCASRVNNRRAPYLLAGSDVGKTFLKTATKTKRFMQRQNVVTY